MSTFSQYMILTVKTIKITNYYEIALEIYIVITLKLLTSLEYRGKMILAPMVKGYKTHVA